MSDNLRDMTQAKWNSLSQADRERLRDLSGLSPKLVGLEGYRVEVLTSHGETKRFIVGRSTGWRPCHIELARTDSHGGLPADRDHVRVTPLRKVRS